MRRALVIAYFFPPLGGAGVQRTLKFVKYLPEFGWSSTVVSTRSRLYPSRDEDLVSEIPAGTRVVRAPALPALRYLAIVFHKLGLMRLKAYVSWPDGGLGWFPGALAAASREARLQRPDVIFSTSAPYSGHLVALVLHRWTGIPWVADFRDEWATNPHLAGQPRALALLNRVAERAITRRADTIVVAADYFQLSVDPEIAVRRVTIHNGVDDSDMRDAGDSSPTDRFRLVFVGTLYGPIDLAPVMAALSQLLTRGAIDPQRFELRIVGNVWIPGFEAPQGIRMIQTGYVPHERAFAEMRAATALLLFVPEESRAPSGKLFEYLAAERPLLCVTRADNLAARLTVDWDAGLAATPSDVDGIAAALGSLFDRWRSGAPMTPSSSRERVLERFSRRELTRRLAVELDAATAS